MLAMFRLETGLSLIRSSVSIRAYFNAKLGRNGCMNVVGRLMLVIERYYVMKSMMAPCETPLSIHKRISKWNLAYSH